MSDNPFILNGKTVLITGASSGIGRETAVQCSILGARVIATGRNSNRLKETLDLLRGEGHQAIVADLTTDIVKIVDEVTELNGIVHSAGILSISPYVFLSESELKNMMNVNFFLPVILTQKLINKKKIKKNSSIIFISSLAGNVVVSKGNSAYSASKSAIVGIAKTLALELASRKIRVNCILPGMVKTEMLNSFMDAFTPDQLEEDEKRYPLGYGHPQDVAYAAIYLLSDASQWLTGTSLILDGGFSLQ